MMRWVDTLKFKIIALAVVTGVLSAVGTAERVLTTTRADIERMLLAQESDGSENTAGLLANKLDTLRITLAAVARQVRPELWESRDGMLRYLEDKPAVNALFGSVVAARVDGETLARLVDGRPTTEFANIADRGYFQQAMKTRQPVVSEPLQGRIDKAPLILFAVAALATHGTLAGVIVGTLALASSRLFLDLGNTDPHSGSRSMVMSRSGILLAHSEPARVMGRAADEPGLAEVFARWRASGSLVATEGSATMSSGYLVSMAGIAASDWVLVRMTPQSIALQPVVMAQRMAWLGSGGGPGAALLAGVVAWLVTRPHFQTARACRKNADTGRAHERALADTLRRVG